MQEIDLNNYSYYENRELSWLEFNQRVLEQAYYEENPIFERIKFMAIVSSNLDEFFMVRVASLKEQVKVGYDKVDFSGLAPENQVEKISIRAHKMIEEQYNHLKTVLIPKLKENGLLLTEYKELKDNEKNYLTEYFNNVIYPVLTPLAVDSSRPFPLIYNKSLNIAVLIKKDEEEMFATVQVPSVLPRIIEIPISIAKTKTYVLLEDVIKENLSQLFSGYKIIAASYYRITRNSDLSIDEEEAQDLLREIEESIKKRKFGDAIRLEVAKGMDKNILDILKNELDINNRDIFFIDGPLDLTFLMKVYSLSGYQHFKYKDYTPQIPKDLYGKTNIFDAIKEKDILLHHPYESFDSVVEFIRKAAKDPDVLAIKQTLYRVSGNSPIIHSLARAAEAGKQVTVLVELKARFDEENNIQWAKKLEKSGCHVIYGLVGLKTHSKITLIVRKEDDGIRRYVHLGTGNYNDITARFYTDLGILTCSEQMGADASDVFNTLSGYSEPPKLRKMVMAPTDLRKKLEDLIKREIENAKAGKKAKIIVKMNSLCDYDIMQFIYKASIAGVKIELIVRGICCVIPDIKGVSDNITVRSIVGRYLEHSRIFYFYNDGKEKIFLSSADWMPRNLNRRVELLFPVRDETNKQRVKEVLEIAMKDNTKSKYKKLNCLYEKIEQKEQRINMQEYFMKQASKVIKEEKQKNVFVPIVGRN